MNKIIVIALYSLLLVGCKSDDETLCDSYEREGISGNSNGYRLLGHCYRLGVGREQSNIRAESNFIRAMNNNNLDAKIDLSALYILNFRSQKKIKLANLYLQDQRFKSNGRALFNLAIMYKNGIGVKRNLDLYHEYLVRASQNDHSLSSTILSLGYCNSVFSIVGSLRLCNEILESKEKVKANKIIRLLSSRIVTEYFMSNKDYEVLTRISKP
jgi:hypothetical protein